MSKFMRRGDQVIAIAGNNKSKTGKVLSRRGDRVIVEGLNVRKKHAKKTQQAPGQIIEREMPIHVSNLSIVNPQGEPVKLKVRLNAQNERELYYLDSNSQQVLYRSVKKSK